MILETKVIDNYLYLILKNSEPNILINIGPIGVNDSDFFHLKNRVNKWSDN